MNGAEAREGEAMPSKHGWGPLAPTLMIGLDTSAIDAIVPDHSSPTPSARPVTRQDVEVE